MGKTNTENMVVKHVGANIIGLPYDNSEGKGVYFHFKPGNNTITKATWEAIKKYNKKNMSFYLKKLKPIQIEEVASIKEESRGLGDVVVDVSKMNVDPVVELIKGTTELATLQMYWGQESKGKNRKGIITAIEEQMAEVEARIAQIKEE